MVPFVTLPYTYYYVRRKPPSPEPNHRRETAIKLEPSANGKWSGPSYPPQNSNFSALSPKSPDYDDADEDDQLSEQLDRRYRKWELCVSITLMYYQILIC